MQQGMKKLKRIGRAGGGIVESGGLWLLEAETRKVTISWGKEKVVQKVEYMHGTIIVLDEQSSKESGDYSE